MISFRYHIASLVAVLLALGAGVALGAGPLQDDDEPTNAGAGNTDTSTQSEQQQDDVFDDAFVSSYLPSLVADSLSGRAVTLLVLPTSTPDQVAALTAALGQAAATVAGTVRVSPELVDAGQRQLVDELGGQLEAGATKLVIDAGAGTYDRLGALLAYAVSTTAAGGDAIDEQGKGILAGLTTAGLISTEGELQQRGSLVLVVSGAPEGDESSSVGSASIVASLAKAIDGASGGVVVAGPASAADPAGVLTGVRNDPVAVKSVSTVDHADRPAGAIVTMLAMQEQAGEKAGQYGAGPGATGPRPGVTTTAG